MRVTRKEWAVVQTHAGRQIRLWPCRTRAEARAARQALRSKYSLIHNSQFAVVKATTTTTTGHWPKLKRKK